jgi:hypothetical protein
VPARPSPLVSRATADPDATDAGSWDAVAGTAQRRRDSGCSAPHDSPDANSDTEQRAFAAGTQDPRTSPAGYELVDQEQRADYTRCSGGLGLFLSSGHGVRSSKTAAPLTLRFPQVGD